MVEGQMPDPEQIKIRPFTFRFKHEDTVCRMYLERKVKWVVPHTIYAENRQKAKTLAENTQFVGACNHIYRLASLKKV